MKLRGSLVRGHTNTTTRSVGSFEAVRLEVVRLAPITDIYIDRQNVSLGHCLRAAIGSENGSDEATAHPRSSHATLISTRHRWALKAASVDATVATQSLREPKLLLQIDYIRFRDPKPPMERFKPCEI